MPTVDEAIHRVSISDAKMKEIEMRWSAKRKARVQSSHGLNASIGRFETQRNYLRMIPATEDILSAEAALTGHINTEAWLPEDLPLRDLLGRRPYIAASNERVPLPTKARVVAVPVIQSNEHGFQLHEKVVAWRVGSDVYLHYGMFV